MNYPTTEFRNSNKPAGKSGGVALIVITALVVTACFIQLARII